jgi:hypothetical protein
MANEIYKKKLLEMQSVFCMRDRSGALLVLGIFLARYQKAGTDSPTAFF